MQQSLAGCAPLLAEAKPLSPHAGQHQRQQHLQQQHQGHGSARSGAAAAGPWEQTAPLSAGLPQAAALQVEDAGERLPAIVQAAPVEVPLPQPGSEPVHALAAVAADDSSHSISLTAMDGLELQQPPDCSPRTHPGAFLASREALESSSEAAPAAGSGLGVSAPGSELQPDVGSTTAPGSGLGTSAPGSELLPDVDSRLAASRSAVASTGSMRLLPRQQTPRGAGVRISAPGSNPPSTSGSTGSSRSRPPAGAKSKGRASKPVLTPGPQPQQLVDAILLDSLVCGWEDDSQEAVDRVGGRHQPLASLPLWMCSGPTAAQEALQCPQAVCVLHASVARIREALSNSTWLQPVPDQQGCPACHNVPEIFEPTEITLRVCTR